MEEITGKIVDVSFASDKLHFVVVHKAGSIGEQQGPSLRIEAEVPTDDNVPNIKNLNDCAEFYREEGKKLSDAMFACLPGGTVDALLCEMMSRRASMFRVRF
jgi:hypothetical protein